MRRKCTPRFCIPQKITYNWLRFRFERLDLWHLCSGVIMSGLHFSIVDEFGITRVIPFGIHYFWLLIARQFDIEKDTMTAVAWECELSRMGGGFVHRGGNDELCCSSCCFIMAQASVQKSDLMYMC